MCSNGFTSCRMSRRCTMCRQDSNKESAPELLNYNEWDVSQGTTILTIKNKKYALTSDQAEDMSEQLRNNGNY